MANMTIFPEDHLLRICDALANSSSGLTGTEIGTFLLRMDIADPGAGVSKKARLFEALQQRQRRDQDGRAVVQFIQAAMDPGRYVGTAQLFESRRRLLNDVLSESELCVGEDGKVHVVTPPEDIEHSAERVAALSKVLEERSLHHEVVHVIKKDIQATSHFKIAVSLVRVLSDRVRQVSGLTCDGAELVERAFGGLSTGRTPLVALADLMTDSGRSEQASLISLTKGLVSSFRANSGFGPRIPWQLSDSDLLDLAALVSMLHRKLDQAVRLRKSDELYGRNDPPTRLVPH